MLNLFTYYISVVCTSSYIPLPECLFTLERVNNMDIFMCVCTCMHKTSEDEYCHDLGTCDYRWGMDW